MNIKPGEFVIANAGKDKGECFVVLSVENQFLYLCNGKNRKVSNPKKKQIKHVLKAGAYDGQIIKRLEDSNLTDRQIRRSISAFNGNLAAESIIKE